MHFGRAVGRGGNGAHVGHYVALWLSLAVGAGLGVFELSVWTLAAAAAGAAVLAIIAAQWRRADVSGYFDAIAQLWS